MSNWIPQDSWCDMWSVQGIIAGLKEAYVRSSAQVFAEMDDIWERRLDDFEKSATVDPLHLTESVEDPPTTQAPSSKEIEIKCLDRFESILTGKRNPKRFNDTTYYKEEKNWDMLLNHYYDVLYDWQREIQSLSDRGLLVERTSSNDKSKSDNRSSNDKSDRAGKSRQLDGYTVSYHPCTYCGKNHSFSVCQLINHPEANKKGEWVNLASYKKCKELFLKDMTRLKSFPTLPMYRDTAGNAVTYEATNKPEDTSKSDQKRIVFPNDKDRSRSDYSKRPKDDARKDTHDSRKYGGQSSTAYLSAVICKCDDADINALYRKCCLSIN
jgi:hypothetical protein